MRGRKKGETEITGKQNTYLGRDGDKGEKNRREGKKRGFEC